MIDLLKKSVFASMGIALMTREKARELGNKIAKEAKLSETEGKQFVDELLKRVDETRHSLEKTVTQYVDTAMKKVHLVSKTDYDALEKRVATLEKKYEKDK